MGYGDNRYGSDDHRDRRGDEWRRDDERGGRWGRERSSYGSWGGERDREAGYGRGGGGSSDGGRGDGMWDRGRGTDDDDRGFLERAGERVRSWFSDDDEDYRSGRREERGYDRGAGRDSFGGGWGNQRGWDEPRMGGGISRSSGERGRYEDHESSRPARSMFDSGDRDRRQGADRLTGSYGGGRGDGGREDRDEGYRGRETGGGHDPHYSQWRRRQMEELDRDYQDYCRENQSRFEQEFGGWREKRQSQRQMIARVAEHMPVFGSDGQPLGIVDHVRDERIFLTRSDADASGVHHSIPFSWVERVEDRVTVNRTADEAMRHWQEEDRSRALFERPGQGRDGPHGLNQSFAGTYDDKTNR